MEVAGYEFTVVQRAATSRQRPDRAVSSLQLRFVTAGRQVAMDIYYVLCNEMVPYYWVSNKRYDQLSVTRAKMSK